MEKPQDAPGVSRNARFFRRNCRVGPRARHAFTLIELLACPPKLRERRRSLAAFTLIELLVVIGIISILLALLMPTLGQARRRAQSLRFRANLRVVQMSANLHAMDHNQRILLCRRQWYYWYPTGPEWRAHCLYEPQPPGVNMAEQVQLQPYILAAGGPAGGPYTARGAQITTAATCPTAASWGKIYEVIGPTYTINTYATISLGVGPDGSLRTDQIIGSYNNVVRPSEVMHFMDGNMSALAGGWWNVNPAVVPSNITRADRLNSNYRHDVAYDARAGHVFDGAANMAYMDGHVSSMTMSEVLAANNFRTSPAFWGWR